jgi:hypothetical protein
MKIYKSKHGHFYFGQTKENGWFSFHNNVPKIDTFNLCPSGFDYNEEKSAWDEAIDISQDIEIKVFNKFARRTNNYKDLCDFVKTYYPNTTQEELDEQYNYHPEFVRLTDEIIEKSKNSIISDYQYEEIYMDVRNHMNTWNGDIERVTKFVIEHDIPEHTCYYHDIVDVFGCEDNRRRWLLHEFYNDWGTSLDNIITESIEFYPEQNDFDKRYYYVKDKLNKLRIKDIEDFKKRHKKQ